jgi:uncharacterized protein
MSDMTQSATWPTFIGRRPLLSFFALTFFISPLLFLGPLLLAGYSGERWPEIVGSILVAWAPNLAAVIVSGIIGGRTAVRALLAGFLIWRVSWRWYLVAILGPVALIYMVAGLYGLMMVERPSTLLAPLTLTPFLLMLLNHAIRGPLGEEAGWRGFALPRLQARYGALKASLILGVIWSVWHFPYWFLVVQQIFPGASGRMALLFVSLALVVLPLSVIMTWLYNHTRGSLLLAASFHLSWNVANELVDLPWDVQFALLAGLYLLLAVVLAIATCPLTLKPISRGVTL